MMEQYSLKCVKSIGPVSFPEITSADSESTLLYVFWAKDLVCNSSHTPYRFEKTITVGSHFRELIIKALV